MPRVFLAVDEEITVQLLDVVLGDYDIVPRPEHEFHHLRIAGHFLLVAGGEGFDLEIGEQPLDLAVGQFAALDPRRGTDALDRSDTSQRRQTLRRERAQRTPCTLELVDLGDQAQDLGRDLDGVGVDRFLGHSQIYIHLRPITFKPLIQ